MSRVLFTIPSLRRGATRQPTQHFRVGDMVMLPDTFDQGDVYYLPELENVRGYVAWISSFTGPNTAWVRLTEDTTFEVRLNWLKPATDPFEVNL